MTQSSGAGPARTVRARAAGGSARAARGLTQPRPGLIKQFLTDVEWGELDFLIIDSTPSPLPAPPRPAAAAAAARSDPRPSPAPPGTSDEHISIVQYLREAGVDGAVVVSTPQEVAMADVRKELNFCRKTKTPVVGVVENMGRSTVRRPPPLTLL